MNAPAPPFQGADPEPITPEERQRLSRVSVDEVPLRHDGGRRFYGKVVRIPSANVVELAFFTAPSRVQYVRCRLADVHLPEPRRPGGAAWAGYQKDAHKRIGISARDFLARCLQCDLAPNAPTATPATTNELQRIVKRSRRLVLVECASGGDPPETDVKQIRAYLYTNRADLGIRSRSVNARLNAAYGAQPLDALELR